MYITNDNDSNNSNLLSSESLINEAPIGWSSACLDQTLFYYLDCNHINDESLELGNLLDDKS